MQKQVSLRLWVVGDFKLRKSEKIPGSVLLSGSAPKVNQVYSGQRLILQS